MIADLVGDNVGDCAARGADLFESIAAEVISAMILGSTMARKVGCLCAALCCTSFPFLTIYTLKHADAGPRSAFQGACAAAVRLECCRGGSGQESILTVVGRLMLTQGGRRQYAHGSIASPVMVQNLEKAILHK